MCRFYGRLKKRGDNGDAGVFAGTARGATRAMAREPLDHRHDSADSVASVVK